MLLELMRFCGKLQSIGDENFHAVLKRKKKNQRKTPLDFTEACVKWLEQKGIKLQAAVLAAALNEGKNKKAKFSEVKQQKNKMKKRGNKVTFYSMDY